jgi:membrane protein DedA with SNARE-associated domain
VTLVLASGSALPSALSALPTAVAVAVLCAAAVVEIVAVPAVLLPGGTVTLLAGALIGSGRPALAVALSVAAAVVAGDQLAYFSGAAVTSWWRRRRPGRTSGGTGPPCCARCLPGSGPGCGDYILQLCRR